MKTLFIVRHAKSSWSDSSLADVDRPLKGRGVNDAYSASEWLMNNNTVPELIISSSATRALHTAMIFARNFDIDFSSIKIDAKLYEGNAKHYLKCINTIDDNVSSVMVFGHNPSITSLINHLTNSTVSHVPTTGIACLNFDVQHWREVAGNGKLLFFDYPKLRK